MELDLDITDISIRPYARDSFTCFLAKTNPDSLKYLESVSPPSHLFLNLLLGFCRS